MLARHTSVRAAHLELVFIKIAPPAQHGNSLEVEPYRWVETVAVLTCVPTSELHPVGCQTGDQISRARSSQSCIGCTAATSLPLTCV